MAQTDEDEDTDTDILFVESLCGQFAGKGIENPVGLCAEGCEIVPRQFLPEIFRFLQMADVLLQLKEASLLKVRFLGLQPALLLPDNRSP